MRCRAFALSLSSVLALASVAPPAVGQPSPFPTATPLVVRGPAFPTAEPGQAALHLDDWAAARRPGGLRRAVLDGVELAASGGGKDKDRSKTPTEVWGQLTDGPAGRARVPHAARVNLILHW